MPLPIAPPRAPAADHGKPVRGPLHLPPPGWRREPVVDQVLGEVAGSRSRDLARARNVIAEHGLTIEVARLRDRLTRAPVSDVGRLLLATPGVPERLFLAAIREQLSDEVRSEKAERETVRDDSVTAMTTLLTAAIERLGDVLLKAQAGVTVLTTDEPDADDGVPAPEPPLSPGAIAPQPTRGENKSARR